MWNFEDNLSAKDIISRHTSKQERGLFFYNPPINFYIVRKPLLKKPMLIWWRMRAIDVNKYIWLVYRNFIFTVIGPKLDKLSQFA